MATKTAAKKKTTTRAKSTSTAKHSTAKKSMKELPISLFDEKRPDEHQVSGKYTFFYVLFACTTVIFAAVAVRFCMLASDLMNKYESVEVCARNHNCKVVREVEENAGEVVEENTEENL